MNKELCRCGKIAVWVYSPGYGGGMSPFSCDDCVSRGCSCNYYTINVESYQPPIDDPELPEGIINIDWKWIDDTTWVYLDEKGRKYPCCEYDYSEKGFDIDD
jgi:hypothetical protein